MSSEPARRVSPRARWVWGGEQLLGWAGAVVAGRLLAGPLDGGLETLARVLPAAGLVLCVPLLPLLRWRTWRWDVRPEGIDIRSGALSVRRTVVPMPRVQHVDTTAGVVERGLGLASVRVHTAAGAHTIPLLPRPDADALRDRIAGLARDAAPS